MRKKLIYVRHSEKDHSDKSGQRTGLKGFELAQKLGRLLYQRGIVITDVFAGKLPRTWESLVGVLSGLLPSKEFRVHGYVPVGDDELFGTIINDEFKAKVKSGKTNWQALKAVHSDRTVEIFQASAVDTVKIMFVMAKGHTSLVLGHSPVVEAAAEFFFDSEVSKQPDSCEGYIFERDDDGNIAVLDKIELS